MTNGETARALLDQYQRLNSEQLKNLEQSISDLRADVHAIDKAVTRLDVRSGTLGGIVGAITGAITYLVQSILRGE